MRLLLPVCPLLLLLLAPCATALRAGARATPGAAAACRAAPAMRLSGRTAAKPKGASGSLSAKVRSAGFAKEEEEEEEMSDAESLVRWFGAQATLDLSIVAGFAYHMQTQWGGLDFQRALAEPSLKFIIIMPAWALFTQVLRRFGSEDLPNKFQAFEDDPIVKYLGGAKKVRSMKRRWDEAWTVKAQ